MGSILEIRGLPVDFDEDDIYTLCDEFGPLVSCKLEVAAGRRKLLATVVFEDEVCARAAIDELDGGEFEGGVLRVWWAADQDEEGFSDEDEAEDEEDEEDRMASFVEPDPNDIDCEFAA